MSAHKSANNKKSYATIAASATRTASQVPQSLATQPYSSYDSRSVRENANRGGGYSFDECKACRQAIIQGNDALARQIAESYLMKVATIGTNENVVYCSAQELSQTAIDFVNFLLSNGMGDLVVKVVTDVYNGNRAKSLDHSMFLLALCTTVPDSVSGSPSKTGSIRNLGYSFVPELRTGSHFLQWVSTHMAICKAAGSKGTGKGFRNACEAWFKKSVPKQLQYQTIKYANRDGVTMKDVLAMTHIKATSRSRRSAKKTGSSKVRDFLSAGTQFVLACTVNGFETALTELDEIAGRKLSTNSGAEMADALECVAYATAVKICKSENSNGERVIEMINVFGVTHEMVNNNFMKDSMVLAALASREIPDSAQTLAVKVEIMEPYLTGLENLAPFFEAFRSGKVYNVAKTNLVKTSETELDLTEILEAEIAEASKQTYLDVGTAPRVVKPENRTFTMPYGAAIRFLNRLTIGGLFDRTKYPLAPQMQKMLCEFLVDPTVVSKSRIHPFSILTSLATYKAGCGFKGSMTWTPVQPIVSSLEAAMRVSFGNCKPHGKIVAHMIDGSGSMRGGNSTTIPFLNAAEVCAFMVALSMQIENVAAHPERFYAGVFQGWGNYGSWGSDRNGHTYEDITDRLTRTTSLEECQQILSRIDGGMTNMQIAFDYYREMLENSLRAAIDGDYRYKHVHSALQLPGFVELFQLWTDNEINSGKKVPDCLDEYHTVQRTACEAFPRTLDGKEIDPELMFRRHCAKLTIVCTQASNYTVGDPFDSRVLCISGFDSAGPQLITNFLEDWDAKTRYDADVN